MYLHLDENDMGFQKGISLIDILRLKISIQIIIDVFSVLTFLNSLFILKVLSFLKNIYYNSILKVPKKTKTVILNNAAAFSDTHSQL